MAELIVATVSRVEKSEPVRVAALWAFTALLAVVFLALLVGAAAEAAAGVAPFALAFAGAAGRFPERGRPRVVWLGIGAGLEGVRRLGERVTGALRERAVRFDDRPLSAHLTLARVREDASLAEARTVAAALEA